jgi:hypothetical protein
LWRSPGVVFGPATHMRLSYEHFSWAVGLTRGSGEAPRYIFSRDGASSRTDEADMLKARAE